MGTPWLFRGMSATGKAMRRPVAVDRSRTVKKLSGKGSRHRVGSSGSHPLGAGVAAEAASTVAAGESMRRVWPWWPGPGPEPRRPQ